MSSQENCEGCRQRHDCREIYGKLGGLDGPSVTLSVIIAFLAPMLIFIVFLAVGGKLAVFFTASAEVRTGVGLVSAVAATFAWILAAKAINGRRGEDFGNRVVGESGERLSE